MERRTPRAGDDLFWFAEAKKAYAEVARLAAEVHRVQGLWYGACAARTEMRVTLTATERELTLLKVKVQRESGEQ